MREGEMRDGKEKTMDGKNERVQEEVFVTVT